MKEETQKTLEIIANSENWIDLNKQLLEAGITNEIYSDKSKFVEMIKLIWANNYIHEDQVRTPLPGSIAIKNEMKYFIHGTVHSSPICRIDSLFEKDIENGLKECIVIAEDGFVNTKNKFISFDEKNRLGLRHKNQLSSLKYVSSFLFSQPLHSKLFKQDVKNYKQDIFEKASKMKSADQLADIRNDIFREYLPEPLSLNSFFYLADLGTIDNPKETDIFKLPNFIKRCIYEAKFCLDFTQKTKTPEIHVLVGCAHEKPLKYLITHSEILERYKY